MIRRSLVFIQYVALCGALTTHNPNNNWNSVGVDPFFGASWWNQPNAGNMFQTATQMPGADSFLAAMNVSANEPLVPVQSPAPKPPTYETATPVKVTKPVVKNVPTESSISLQDLLRLAMGGLTRQATGATNALSSMFSGIAGAPDTKQNVPDTAPSSSAEVKQKFVTTAPPATSSASQNKVVPTTKTSITKTPPPKPTTSTTTTTTKPTTTQAPVVLKTDKPLSQMTLGEILRLQSKLYPETNQPIEKKTGRPRGCHFKGKFYKPLSEIEKGQTGNWCYGSYCNHEGTVVHWDDHKCTTTPSTPPPTQPTMPTAPVTQPMITNPAQSGGMPGMTNFMNMAGMSGTNAMGNMAGMSEMAGIAAMMAGNAGSSSGSGTGIRGTGTPGLGCFHNGQWYRPGADIENFKDYGRCYGSYCSFNSEIVNWNDRCTATVPPPTTGAGMGGQFGYMDQMGMAGQGGMGTGMSQFSMGGEGFGMGGGGMSQMALGGESGMGMSQMAFGGESGLGMGGGGMGMSQMALGGEGLGGEGGMGMAGQGGMGGRTQGGLTMRQLQQLDLI